MAAGTIENAAVVMATIEREKPAAVAEPEPKTAGPDAELASLAESVPAAANAAPPWQERAQARREQREQRRQERQDDARSRRAIAAGMRAASGPMARAEPAAAVREEPMTTAVHEDVSGTHGPRASDRRMQRGTVKWFSESKGYGFITADDGTDAFVHHSAISGDGYGALSEGQSVSYEEVEGPKGLLAANVVPDRQ